MSADPTPRSIEELSTEFLAQVCYQAANEERRHAADVEASDLLVYRQVAKAEALTRAKWFDAAGDRLVALSRSPEPLVKALEQARREYGAFGSLSGETLSQMDAALRAALAPGEGKDVGQK